MPSAENTCLDKVFSLKNVSNFIHDDVIFSPSESIKMNMLDNHLNVTRGQPVTYDTGQEIRHPA